MYQMNINNFFKSSFHSRTCSNVTRTENLPTRSNINQPQNNSTILPNISSITQTTTELVCFTDGSAINNGKLYATAAFPDFSEYNYSDKVTPATNNRAEYSAVIHAFKQADDIDISNTKQLHVYTDSMLLINTCTKWLSGWKKNNFMTKNKTKVANLDLVMKLDECMKKRKVIFTHVRAHTGANTWEAKYNDLVDKMARNANNLHS